MSKRKVNEQDSLGSVSSERQVEGQGSNQNIKISPSSSPRQVLTKSWDIYTKYKNLTRNQKIVCGLVLAVLSAFVGYSYWPDTTIQNINYDFKYHCPLSDVFQSPQIQLSNFRDEAKKYYDANKEELSRTYYVAALPYSNLSLDEKAKKSLKISYCGFARSHNNTCKQATFICSSPGPAFDVEAYTNITVIWINNYTMIDEQAMENVKGFNKNKCFEKDSKGATEMCNKTAKERKFSSLFMYDPIDNFPSVGCPSQNKIKPQKLKYKVESKRSSTPLSPHVHGLEVQPYYDGNPLSWWDNQGNIGVGFVQTDETNKKYLNDPTLQKFFNLKGYQGEKKINVYKNVQQPGSLWYHDHAMGVTSFNVRLGLHSYYIIRDKKIQAHLPSGDYEKIIFMHSGIQQPTLIKSCQDQCFLASQSDNCLKCLSGVSGIKTMQQSPLEYNVTYRFRILNGDFGTSFNNIRFIYSTCVQTFNKSSSLQQNCNFVLSFSVIGTDSALRSVSVDHLQSIDLTPGERVDLLLTTSTSKGQKFKQTDRLYVISNSTNSRDQYILLSNFSLINGPKKENSKYMKLQNITLNTPFVDLKNIREQDIAIKRMRPFFFSSNFEFGINGHVRFHSGASQTPRIGTIQDWYLINPMWIGHPAHIHLIQFQALQVYQLLKVQNTTNFPCTKYWMDFLRLQGERNLESGDALDITKQILNVSQNWTNSINLCRYCNQSMTSQKYSKFFANFANEDKNQPISGLDVLACQNNNEPRGNCTIYKYVNRTNNILKPYQNGWKQTFFLSPYTYSKVRVRWTRTDFPLEKMNYKNPADESACKEKYFHIEQSQITKSPGYVYHCHILSHEDLEMMRPIMVQPSGCENLKSWSERWQQQYCQFDPSKVQKPKKQNYDDKGDLRK